MSSTKELDIHKSLEMYRKAGEQGIGFCLYKLFQEYYYGDHIERDHEKAFEWLQRSADNRCSDALVDMCLIHLGIKDIEVPGLKVNKREAERYIWFAAHSCGNKRAQFIYANLIEEGRFGKSDLRESFKLARSAAPNGTPKAQYYLALKYLKGRGTELNMESAFKWFLKAAKRGLLEAQISVAKMYDEGTGVEKDETKALEWLLKAAEQGDLSAMFSVFARYNQGIGVEANSAKAQEWAERYDKRYCEVYGGEFIEG